MKKCTHINCIICPDIIYRDMLEKMLKKSGAEILICSHVKYIAESENRGHFSFDLSQVKHSDMFGYFTIHPITGELVKLNAENVKVHCMCEGCICK